VHARGAGRQDQNGDDRASHWEPEVTHEDDEGVPGGAPGE
jgi:hypothetical protein